jgi:DNA (cytosine-5)-methyltransferase 1
LNFLEFFAGGGMARLGLKGWHCVFANDNDTKKAKAYLDNFPDANHCSLDIQDLTAAHLPDVRADLAWASFPCQDLSLAGNGAGLSGDRSGTFWAFKSILRDLNKVNRAPGLVVLENVVGAITSNSGQDFQEILKALRAEGYGYSPLVVDGSHFVPQSRPRLFIIAFDGAFGVPESILTPAPNAIWHPESLQFAFAKMPDQIREAWVWLALPKPAARRCTLGDVLEADEVMQWHPTEHTRQLLGMMNEVNRAKVKQAQRFGKRVVGTLYRRTRSGSQRAEIRFDGISGCLRTPGGGSSRQTLVVVQGDTIKSRLISVREAARLMGVPDSYKLPQNYNDAYHLMGDGLVVPAVYWISESILKPLYRHQKKQRSKANAAIKPSSRLKVSRPHPASLPGILHLSR